ncbi:MAG: lytic murein transglycosylase [Rhodobacteraceae bacterium]|nr:lytic murein transglycosylase [Paracoccaceae bacterium]
MDQPRGIFSGPFWTLPSNLISWNRIDHGWESACRYAWVFGRIESQDGVLCGGLLAFWAFVTDYGSFQDDFNTRDALVTLSHDCR